MANSLRPNHLPLSLLIRFLNDPHRLTSTSYPLAGNNSVHCGRALITLIGIDSLKTTAGKRHRMVHETTEEVLKTRSFHFFPPNLFFWSINPHTLYSDRQRPPPYGEIKESYASEADRSVNPYYSPDINRHYVWVLFSFKIFWQREQIYYLSCFSIVVQTRMERARKKCEQRLPSRGSSLQRSILRKGCPSCSIVLWRYQYTS